MQRCWSNPLCGNWAKCQDDKKKGRIFYLYIREWEKQEDAMFIDGVAADNGFR